MRFLILLFSILLAGCFAEPPKPSTLSKQYSAARVKTAALSVDAHFALTVDQQEVCVWDNKVRTKLYSCFSDALSNTIEFSGISANNEFFFLSNRLSVSLYRLSNGQRLNQWSTGSNIINDIDISADGKVIVLGYRSGETSVISTVNGSLTTFQVHALDINSVSLSGDGSKAFTGSSDKLATLWDTSNGKTISSFKHKTRVNHVDISSNGEFGLSLDAIKGRFIWDLVSYEEHTELNTSLKFLEFNHSAFSHDMKRLVSGSPNRKVQLWDTDSGELMQSWISYKHEGRDRSSVLAVALTSSRVTTINNDGMYEEFEIVQPSS